MNTLRTLLFLIFAQLPTQSLALSIWVPQNFGEYIDNLDALNLRYKIVYGHFASIDQLTVEDTTSERPAAFIANGYQSKFISAPAIFELVDPRRNQRRHGQLDVVLTRYWNSAPDFQGYRPEADSYKHLNFINLGDPVHGDRIFTLIVNANGTLTETGEQYIFSGPYSRAQARELMRCVFDGACGQGDIRQLRQLPY